MQLARESLFVSSIRSFFNTFFGFLGVIIALFLAVIAFVIFSTGAPAQSKTVFTIEPDVNGNRDLLVPTTPAILKINIHGVIGSDKLNSQTIETQLLDSRDQLLTNNRVKAIMLDVNTPGGTVTDADTIYRMLLAYKEKYKVPIYAYVNGMCASGGMYIASAADRIYASPPSIIGSVGVIMGPVFNFSELMQKWGVHSLTLTQGKDKDMLNPFRPWKENEDESLRVVTQYLYNSFVDIVVSARPNMSKTALVEEYGAQVYVAEDAQSRGYIDETVNSYFDALKDLVQKAGIEENDKYQVVQLKIQRPYLSDLLQGKFAHGPLSMLQNLGGTKENEPLFYYLYQPTFN